jgi:hypothetical protein
MRQVHQIPRSGLFLLFFEFKENARPYDAPARWHQELSHRATMDDIALKRFGLNLNRWGFP